MLLGSLADIRSGSLHDRDGDGALYALAADIVETGLRTSRLTPGTPPSKSGATAALTGGDLVVGLRGAVNPAAVVPSLDHLGLPVFATLDVAVLRTSALILPDYLAWFLNHPATQFMLAADRSGSTAPRLPLPALKALDVPLPSLARQAMIAAVAADAQQERALVDKIQQSRTRLFDELLRRAADEGPVSGCNPPRTDHHPAGRGATSRALSNPDDWKQ